MKLKRIKAVELQLHLTLRFAANINEHEAREFIRDAIKYAAAPSEPASDSAAARAIELSSLKVFVASKTTFNIEKP